MQHHAPRGHTPPALRSPHDLTALDRAAALAWRAARAGIAACKPGVSTRDVAAAIKAAIEAGGGIPAFEGYRTSPSGAPFPGVACIAVGEEAVHAPPGPRLLAPGDLISIDVGVELAGWHGDIAESILLPGGSDECTRLRRACRRTLAAGIRACTPGAWWSEVARAVRSAAATDGFMVLPGYAGHGIGRALHERPRAGYDLRAGNPGDFLLLPGLAFTIEPVLVSPPGGVEIGPDGWTVRTADGSPACHTERMVAITRRGRRILGLRERCNPAAKGL